MYLAYFGFKFYLKAKFTEAKLQTQNCGMQNKLGLILFEAPEHS